MSSLMSVKSIGSREKLGFSLGRAMNSREFNLNEDMFEDLESKGELKDLHCH